MIVPHCRTSYIFTSTGLLYIFSIFLWPLICSSWNLKISLANVKRGIGNNKICWISVCRKLTVFWSWTGAAKGGRTLNDLYNTTCRTIGFSNFHCVYTIIQVVHSKFIKIVLTEYSVFKSLSKISQKQVAAAVIIAVIYRIL